MLSMHVSHCMHAYQHNLCFMGQVYDGGVNPREMELNGDNNDHSEYIYHDVTLMFPYQNMCTIYNIITRFSI